MNKTVFALSFLFCLLFPVGVLGQNFPDAPPFNAWINTAEDVFLLPDYERRGESIALLRFGDQVRVVECQPSCNARGAWMKLEPYGIVRSFNLSVGQRPSQAEFEASYPMNPNYVWGRALRATEARDVPDPNGAVCERIGRGDELLFRRGTSPLFLERSNNCYVPHRDIELFQPSTFSGWSEPPDHFGFIIKDTLVTHEDGTTAPLTRYHRLPAVADSRGLVRVAGGTVPSVDMRVGSLRVRPSGVPANVRWVHVDLATQILTAYNGDNLVFATLVSTGRRSGSTRTGTFQVRRKITYTQMRGGGRRPYSVEGVPWVLYFDDAIALHGSYWHDRFGRVMSHGCVNLSPADARWVYDFHPVQVPRGWRSIHPISRANFLSQPNANLWVVVE